MTIMKVVERRGVTKSFTAIATSLAVVLLLWGCVVGPGPGGYVQPSSQPIGTVEAFQGPNVTVAGRPAYSRMPVYENEEVRTGPGSTATVLLRGGGLLQLDENTDPVFSLISQTFCVLIQMFRGHAQLDSQGRCIEAATPESQAFINSKIDIRVESGATTWRVLEGAIEVALRARPQQKIRVTAGQRILVSRAGLERAAPMPEPEVQELHRRFLQLHITPRVPVQPRIEPGLPAPPTRPRIEPSVPPPR
jgi:hypothetical protein